MIERNVTNKSARHHRENYCRNQGIRPGDPRFDLDLLPLGRIAMSDWSNCSVLDRMMLYERRIENSLHKTINRLKQYQVIRRIEKEDANRQQPAPESDNPVEKLGDLKKQSQFAAAHLVTMSCMQRGYDKYPVGGGEENKAKLSQYCADVLTQGAGKGDKSVPAATG